MKEIIAKLADFKDLSSAEMTDVIERIVTGRVTESQIVAFLLGLKMKGETIEERTALAQVMRGHAKQIPTTIRTAMDNCGTGGDKSSASIFRLRQLLYWQVAGLRWLSTAIAPFF